MKIFKRKELERLDDRFENECHLNILTTHLPNFLKQFEDKETRYFITSKIEDGYTLVIQNSNLSPKKTIKQCSLLSKNSIFSLYSCNKQTLNTEIVDFLEEYEYTRGFNFFLVKDINNVKISLPQSSQERIEIEIIGENKIILVQIDIKLVTELVWVNAVIG